MGRTMLRRLYDRLLAVSASPGAPWWLALVSFAESSFFPIPPDVMLIPMVIARSGRAWRLAFICTASSVLGGLLGYAIGYGLYDEVARPLIHFYHYEAAAEAFIAKFQEWGLWVILIKGLTPIPFKIVTITSGLTHFNLGVFIAASVLTRGLRFFLVAALLRRFGEPVREMVEKRLTLVTTVLAVSIVGGFLMLRVL
jgi:membrane protein YqaA with SNARE-associated domain